MGGERALLLMRNDDVATAQRLLNDLGITPESAQAGICRDRAERLWARLVLAQGHPERALELTAPAVARARRSDQQHKLVELLVLQALALSRRGEAAGARGAIMESLTIAALHGYKRLFLDEGAELARLLRVIVLQPQASTPALAHARCILASSDAVPPGSNGFVQQRPTERELQLLAMLAQGLSNVEIAYRLEVTEGTVKWHLHNLYGKLGVRNRTGALREAKSRGLLAH
jgi:ATP/maltotriose-dependent transcriptional regulator MalT